MSIREGTMHLTVERLLDSVRQLSPTELWEFTERFVVAQMLGIERGKRCVLGLLGNS